MKEIDWSKAPEGATHYSCDDRHAPWLKVEAPDRAFWWDGQRWEPVIGFRMPLPAEYVPIHAAGPVPIPAPDDLQAPPWNGEGLPPVGTVCEALISGGWYRGTVIGHCVPPRESFAAFQGDGLSDLIFGSSEYFRPIRTPEQIAAEERERAISEMLRIYTDGAAGHSGGIAALYDAGYRRQEPKE